MGSSTGSMTVRPGDEGRVEIGLVLGGIAKAPGDRRLEQVPAAEPALAMAEMDRLNPVAMQRTTRIPVDDIGPG